MAIAIYPGSFDPVTFGHLDIIRRASSQFEQVVVGVLNNSSKTPLFSAEERVKILEKVTADIPNVVIRAFSGLSVHFAKESNATVIIRGLRAITDFEYELQLAQTNRVLDKDIDTMFLTTSLEYAYLSSSTVKEAASFGADISQFLPPYAAEKVHEKYQMINKESTK
ncbi:MAG: pantetheine-phosphate adenylyltransferase [Lachnospiraceae bacterium]|jgi:pantetheine-phosphate adenylyltransferase